MNEIESELALKRLSDPLWRINNLYWIVDKYGRFVKFKLNWAQEQLYNEMWYCNVILKARQLGMSTFVTILFLDRCLFNRNKSAGIIAHTLEDAQQLFRRVKVAYDNLPGEIKNSIKADSDTAQMLKFSNGSSLRVGTSLRSSTFQYLHISEFGKICAKYPDKAQEIVTGSLNTIASGQYIFIESTAEGKEGYFYDICKRAQDMRKDQLTKLDFKFHFYPWWGESNYRIGSVVTIDDEMQEYFEHLHLQGINLNEQQMWWYAAKAAIQGDDMRREYPSTPEEAWQITNEGLYYVKPLYIARNEGRISRVPYEEELLVHTAWDLGYNDSNAIWFFQVYRNEIRLIEYVEGSGESLSHWLNEVKKRDYAYGMHLAPHDVMVHEYSSGLSRQASARKLGITLTKVPKVEIIPGIDAVRAMMHKCWFDEKKCIQGIKCLENYKKDWDDRHGCWRTKPLHNWSSHGADAFRTLATGIHLITGQNTHDQKKLDQQQREYMQNRFNSQGSFR